MIADVSSRSHDRALLVHLVVSTVAMLFLGWVLGELSKFSSRGLPLASEMLLYVNSRDGAVRLELPEEEIRAGMIPIRDGFHTTAMFCSRYQQTFSGPLDVSYALMLMLVPVGTIYACMYYRLLRWREQKHRRYLLWYLLACAASLELFLGVPVSGAA